MGWGSVTYGAGMVPWPEMTEIGYGGAKMDAEKVAFHVAPPSYPASPASLLCFCEYKLHLIRPIIRCSLKQCIVNVQGGQSVVRRQMRDSFWGHITFFSFFFFTLHLSPCPIPSQRQKKKKERDHISCV
jgi:hypothetical protein